MSSSDSEGSSSFEAIDSDGASDFSMEFVEKFSESPGPSTPSKAVMKPEIPVVKAQALTTPPGTPKQNRILSNHWRQHVTSDYRNDCIRTLARGLFPDLRLRDAVTKAKVVDEEFFRRAKHGIDYFEECTGVANRTEQAMGSTLKLLEENPGHLKHGNWRDEVSLSFRNDRIVGIAEAKFPDLLMRNSYSEAMLLEKDLFKRARNVMDYCELYLGLIVDAKMKNKKLELFTEVDDSAGITWGHPFLREDLHNAKEKEWRSRITATFRYSRIESLASSMLAENAIEKARVVENGLFDKAFHFGYYLNRCADLVVEARKKRMEEEKDRRKVNFEHMDSMEFVEKLVKPSNPPESNAKPKVHFVKYTQVSPTKKIGAQGEGSTRNVPLPQFIPSSPEQWHQCVSSDNRNDHIRMLARGLFPDDRLRGAYTKAMVLEAEFFRSASTFNDYYWQCLGIADKTQHAVGMEKGVKLLEEHLMPSPKNWQGQVSSSFRNDRICRIAESMFPDLRMRDAYSEAMILEKSFLDGAKDAMEYCELYLELIVEAKMKNKKLELLTNDLELEESSCKSWGHQLYEEDRFGPCQDWRSRISVEFRENRVKGIASVMFPNAEKAMDEARILEKDLFESAFNLGYYCDNYADLVAEARMKRKEAERVLAEEKKKKKLTVKEKDWRQEVAEEFRTQRILEIAEALFPDRRMKSAIAESKKVEKELFEKAKNLGHYCNMCSLMATGSVSSKPPKKVEMDWRQKINRKESIKSLATVILLDNDPNCLVKVDLSHLMEYIKKVEIEIFESAGSREEYDRRILEKIEVMKKEKAERIREELLEDSSSNTDEKIQKLEERVEELELKMREELQKVQEPQEPQLSSESAPSEVVASTDSRPILNEITGIWKLVAEKAYHQNTIGFMKINAINDRIILMCFKKSRELETVRNVLFTSKDVRQSKHTHDYLENNQWITISPGHRIVARIVNGQLRVDRHFERISFTDVYERTQGFEGQFFEDGFLAFFIPPALRWKTFGNNGWTYKSWKGWCSFFITLILIIKCGQYITSFFELSQYIVSSVFMTLYSIFNMGSDN